jgi:hypothetical protein
MNLAPVGSTALADCGCSTGDSDLESPTDRSPPLAVESVPERGETFVPGRVLGVQ